MIPSHFVHFDLEALARSIEARKEFERQRRAAMQLPEAVTAGGTVFRYIPVKRDDNVNGCDTDWVFMCSCRHVAVILCEASALTDNARAARMRALGWAEPSGDRYLWRCPDCIAVWKILNGGAHEDHR